MGVFFFLEDGVRFWVDLFNDFVSVEWFFLIYILNNRSPSTFNTLQFACKITRNN